MKTVEVTSKIKFIQESESVERGEKETMLDATKNCKVR